MIAEVSMIIGALKAVNEGIAAFKEAGDNASGIASFFGSHSEAKESIKTIEQETAKGTRRLTREEALDLAWAKKALREQEKEFKKSIPRDVWTDMLFIQSKSIAEEKHADLTAVLQKRKRKAELKKTATEILSILVGCSIIAGAVYYIWYA